MKIQGRPTQGSVIQLSSWRDEVDLWFLPLPLRAPRIFTSKYSNSLTLTKAKAVRRFHTYLLKIRLAQNPCDNR